MNSVGSVFVPASVGSVVFAKDTHNKASDSIWAFATKVKDTTSEKLFDFFIFDESEALIGIFRHFLFLRLSQGREGPQSAALCQVKWNQVQPGLSPTVKIAKKGDALLNKVNVISFHTATAKVSQTMLNTLKSAYGVVPIAIDLHHHNTANHFKDTGSTVLVPLPELSKGRNVGALNFEHYEGWLTYVFKLLLNGRHLIEEKKFQRKKFIIFA